jgi:hypothetical protein
VPFVGSLTFTVRKEMLVMAEEFRTAREISFQAQPDAECRHGTRILGFVFFDGLSFRMSFLGSL